MMSQDAFNNLPPLTVIPHPVDDTDNFLQWLNRFYEEIALVVNPRVVPYSTIQISSTAANIPNLPTFGSYLIAVSGVYSTQPTGVWALCKADSTASGAIAVLESQVGTGAWAGFALTITSTATNFQIAHNNTGVTDFFNISVLGTQILPF